jgi:hypothetical protein
MQEVAVKNIIVSSLLAVALALPPTAGADAPQPKPPTPKAPQTSAAPQTAPSTLPTSAGDSGMEALRDKLRADKRYVIARNMDLTETEAKGFWPIYDEYQKGLSKLNGRIATLTGTYLDAHEKAPISEELSRKLLNDAWDIDRSELELEKDCMGKMKKVLPAYKVFRYAQLENKIRAVVKYELAASIPIAD